jgi:hypothetical protein
VVLSGKSMGNSTRDGGLSGAGHAVEPGDGPGGRTVSRFIPCEAASHYLYIPSTYK